VRAESPRLTRAGPGRDSDPRDNGPEDFKKSRRGHYPSPTPQTNKPNSNAKHYPPIRACKSAPPTVSSIYNNTLYHKLTHPMHINRIAIIGAGTMGRGIAQVFAQAGLEVLLYDSDPDALAQSLATITERLRQQCVKGHLQEAACATALDALQGIERLEAIDADMIIEVVPERLDLKLDIFTHLRQVAQARTILASNTSGLDISALAQASARPDKVIGMHFFNPPPIMPLIEVVRASETSEETFVAVIALAERLGKTPIPVANSPGFVANRILFPMINEAIYALAEGVASAADIDRVLVLGASHPLGPLALADFVGLDVTLDILDSFARRFDNAKYCPCPLLREMVDRGELGRKTGQGFFSYP
jgi:3-hydroxybutyryl-CoA dehydrogenase